MKRTLMTLSVIVLAAASAFAQNDRYDKRAIAYAKRISVSQLDSSLADQHFERWFRAVVGHEADIEWGVNDCGEQTGSAADIGRDFPSCVEVDVELSDGRKIVISIAVGTFAKGISGSPSLNEAFVDDRGTIRDVKKLSDLPAALRGNT